MALEQRVKDELAKIYKVPEDKPGTYDQFYDDRILPLINEKYLAHLVSAVEDLIFEKRKKENPHVPRYRIILWKNNPSNGKANMRALPNGAVIAYNPKNDKRDLRIFIAHELGHLLLLHKVINDNHTENRANLFAYFAINGKNKFYMDKSQELIYKDELEIISSIQAACPITQYDQSDCRLGTHL
jgi:Zn-dependent peptidase ImmA (M78 family)